MPTHDIRLQEPCDGEVLRALNRDYLAHLKAQVKYCNLDENPQLPEWILDDNRRRVLRCLELLFDRLDCDTSDLGEEN